MMMLKNQILGKAIVMGCCLCMMAATKGEAEEEPMADKPVLLEAYVYRTGLLTHLNFEHGRGMPNQKPLIQTTVRYWAPADLGYVASMRNFRITHLQTDAGVVVPIEDINQTHSSQASPTRLDSGVIEYSQGFSVRIPSITTTHWSLIRAEVDLVLQADEPLSAVLPAFKDIKEQTIRVLRSDGQAIHLRAQRRSTSVGTQTQIQVEMSDEDWQWIDSITAESRHGIPIAMQPRGHEKSDENTTRYFGINQKNIDDLRLRLRVFAQQEVVDGIIEIRDVPLPSLLFLPNSDGPALREAPE